MPSDKQPTPPESKNISIDGDVVDSVVIAGDHNTVNQTIFQKIVNIFKNDAETLEHRNRRILLNHVENAWIKGVLDASLHGAVMLELGIKEDPDAVNKYPWTIKKELTDETLPAGTSMLEIFESIGLGRSLLILGAPGSGKTTMLLELARQLIARAREDVTQPIPIVFNLASWTEKLTLADWLAHELNNLYSVPRKTAPDWIKANKLLLLLDGLDEVRQESRTKCVDAINKFKKENGLTSLSVCSRSQDYAELNSLLIFDGAIELQPLTNEQVENYFDRFSKQLASARVVLKKDNALREIAKSPLFLSIMTLAYRDKEDIPFLVFSDKNSQRKHLFNSYIKRMFEHAHLKNEHNKKQYMMDWLRQLAQGMIVHDQIPYFVEQMQISWLSGPKMLAKYRWHLGLILGTIYGLAGMLTVDGLVATVINVEWIRLILGVIVFGLGMKLGMFVGHQKVKIHTVDSLVLDWNSVKYLVLPGGVMFALFLGFLAGLLVSLEDGWEAGVRMGLISGVVSGLLGASFGLILALLGTEAKFLIVRQIDKIILPGQMLVATFKNFFLTTALGFMLLLIFFTPILISSLLGTVENISIFGCVLFCIVFGLFVGFRKYGGNTLIRYYFLRFMLARNNLLPWKLIPFLNHCVDLIFLRRVGGGYIFVHRLLMEHFAEMDEETINSLAETTK
jgi:hypothetical protein